MMRDGWAVVLSSLQPAKWRYWIYHTKAEADAHAAELMPLTSEKDRGALLIVTRPEDMWSYTIGVRKEKTMPRIKVRESRKGAPTRRPAPKKPKPRY